MEWLLYIIAFIMFVAFISTIYIRIKYPFWSFMDANHSYDWFLRRPGKPISIKPCRNKYVVRAQVKTAGQDGAESLLAAELVAQLLQRHLIPSDKILYECEAKHIEARMTGHDAQASLYYDFDYPLITKPSGTIVSYPVHIMESAEETKPSTKFAANYISHVAAAEDVTIQKLIATHIYNVHDKNPYCPAFLLKKDVGRCAGLRPITTFSTNLYFIEKAPSTSKPTTPTTLVQIYKDNWHQVVEAIASLKGFAVALDIGAIQARVKAGILFVYALMYRGTTIAMYFIEDAHMLYEHVADHGGKTLRLVATVSASLASATVGLATDEKTHPTTSSEAASLGDSFLYLGFLEALAKIIKQNADYKMLLVDGLGSNQVICEKMIEDKQIMKLTTTTGAYYFVNWAYRKTWESKDVFILV
jgi:hypothetical protein